MNTPFLHWKVRKPGDATNVNRSVLVSPGAEHRKAAEREDHEERDRVEADGALEDVVADRDHDQGGTAVERDERATRPERDLVPAFAPEEEEEERDRQEEGDAREDLQRRQCGVQVEHDDRERDRRNDQESAQRRMLGQELPHAVMKARTASAPARTVAPPNHRSRRRGSTGA